MLDRGHLDIKCGHGGKVGGGDINLPSYHVHPRERQGNVKLCPSWLYGVIKNWKRDFSEWFSVFMKEKSLIGGMERENGGEGGSQVLARCCNAACPALI